MLLLRHLLLLALALLITLAIFIFMQRLINTDGEAIDQVELAGFVELYKPPPSQEPETEVEPEQEDTNIEPQMQSVTSEAADNQPKFDVDIPTLDSGSLAMSVGSAGAGWSAPLANSDGLLEIGEDSKGYVEIVPYATRQPSIPELAWKNKTSGWVLVVFNVARDGRTKNIRILDANPRGVFEESVVSAVEKWRYAVGKLKNYQGDMVLTQRLELNWQDYRAPTSRGQLK